jgi:proton-coupled amino acid transporter
MIIEDYLYKGWPKTPKRMWSKNVTRTLLVAFTVVFTMFLGNKMDKFLSILGGLCCTPIAFTFPALFHLKAVAKTRLEKTVDISIIVLSMCILVFCTTLGFYNWSE